MPTIALVVQQGFGARVLLQTEVLSTLVKAGARLVVLTSDAPTVGRYLRGRGLNDVAVEELDVEGYRRRPQGVLRYILRLARAYGVSTRTVDDTFRMQWKDTWRARSLGGLSLLVAIWLLTRAMRLSGSVMRAVVALENRLDAPDVHGAFFGEYRPDAVVVTSMGTFDEDRYVIREAKRHGARVVSYVLSWDNTTVRGLGVNLADRIIVWSEVMKEELVKLHRISPRRVAVDGVPHYDYYVTGKADADDRAELTRRFDVDPSKRLLLLGTKSPNTFLYNADVAEAICAAIREGRLPGDCHLIVRLHPIYFRDGGSGEATSGPMDEWEALRERYGDECLSVDYPAIIDGRLRMFMPDDEIVKLAGLLKHSEVVVNMFSTLNLEASIFDRPIVNVAFDFDHKRPPGTKVARFNIHYDEVQTHNQRVVHSGGASVAHSVDELIEQINRYLEAPTLHAEGRRRIVDRECGANLGHAGEAVGRTILNAIVAGA